jgi:hypothetical protein
MSAETIVSELLNVQPIIDLVGDKRALARLPHDTHMPALIYNVVTDMPAPMVDYSQNCLHRARVQFNPLAKTIGEVKQIQAAMMQAMNYKQNVQVGEALVVWCRVELIGQVDKDDETAVWTQPVDYMLEYYPKV